MKKYKKAIITSALLIGGIFSATIANANDYPSKQINYVIAFGPGGGNDLMSRIVVDIINKYDFNNNQNIVVTNRAGGSGSVGFGYVSRQKGNPYFITSTSGMFVSTPLVSNTEWNYTNFTPVGLLANDAMMLVVRNDSELKNLDDFVNRAKSSRIIVGGTGASSPSRVVTGMFAESAGIQIQYIPAGTGGEMVTALTSGSVHAIVGNPSEVAGQVAAGNFRILAYSDTERSPVYPEVPTFIEEGYDFSFSLPRGIVMPAEVTQESQEWWIETLKKVTQTPEWNEYLITNSLAGQNLWGDDFYSYLEQTSNDFERILRDIGAIR